MVDNKQQAGPGKQSSPTVQVGDSSNGVYLPRRLRTPKIGKRSRFSLGILAFLIIVIGGWLVIHGVFHIGEKVYAKAAGHKIYRKEIDAIMKGSRGVTVKNAATVLADKYLYQKMLKDGGVVVTNQDVAKQYPDIDSKKTSVFMRQYDTNEVYAGTLVAYNAGLYKGKLLVTNFSLHILANNGPTLEAQQKTFDPLAGNAAVINRDKQYAYNLISSLYNQIKSKKITFDQAIQAERNDPRVGVKAYSTLPHSGSFDTSNSDLAANSLLVPVSIQRQVASIKPGTLTKPFVVRVANSVNPKNKGMVESYWLVVQMDSSKGSHSGLSYDQYLAQAKKKLGYKVYG